MTVMAVFSAAAKVLPPTLLFATKTIKDTTWVTLIENPSSKEPGLLGQLVLLSMKNSFVAYFHDPHP